MVFAVDKRGDLAEYVVYHNPDAMKFPATEVTKFEIVTNKRVRNAVGDRVWLLTGEGRPRNYYLRLYFYVDDIVSGEDYGFRTRLSGKTGQMFDPMRSLDDEPWFSDLKGITQNFRYGLTSISDPEIISGLERVAKSAARAATGK